MTTTTNTRPAFPTNLDGPGCPNCGSQGTLQAVEWGLKVWDFIAVEDGTVKFEGSFDWTEDSRDEHIACWSCGTQWSMPERVDYL